MKDKHRDEQLARFFQHNPIEDPLYLKRYVKDHPDHKMAWYLLGREYAAKGQAGKAAYCFAQSGEIYEAFERQKVVVDSALPAAPSSATAGQEAPAKARRSAVKRAIGAAVLLFLLLLIPTSIDMAKERADVSRHSQEIGASAAEQPNEGGLNAAVPPQPPSPLQEGLRIYFSGGDSGTLLPKVIAPQGERWRKALLVEGELAADSGWVEWNKPLKPLLGVELAGEAGNAAALQYYSAQLCSCTPGDPAPLLPVIQGWQMEREQALVLKTALLAYQRNNGALPQKAADLAQPYPKNILPGVTPAMEAMLPQMLAELQESGTAPAAGNPAGEAAASASPQQQGTAPSASGSQQPSYPFEEPLEIVIDVTKHRLALVSGNIVLRSYPVGLGGAKTPLGQFVISEKVRNPNGKSNGEFGSRGMTLSDTLYAIHGTNKPSSIGKDESHGCIRMLQADVEELYDMAPQQTKVTIGKGIIPDAVAGTPDGAGGDGGGAGKGDPQQAFRLPLQTDDSNPKKTYKWLD